MSNDVINQSARKNNGFRLRRTKSQVMKVSSSEDQNRGLAAEERFVSIGLGSTRSFTKRTMSFARKVNDDQNNNRPSGRKFQKKTPYDGRRGRFSITQSKERRESRNQIVEEEVEKENDRPMTIFGLSCCHGR